MKVAFENIRNLTGFRAFNAADGGGVTALTTLIFWSALTYLAAYAVCFGIAARTLA